jgi:predicted transcriptional regulator
MSEAVEIPDPVMHLIEQLKIRPDEEAIDVITRALESLSDDYIDEETEEAIRTGIEEYCAGIFTTEEEMAKKIGLK